MHQHHARERAPQGVVGEVHRLSKKLVCFCRINVHFRQHPAEGLVGQGVLPLFRRHLRNHRPGDNLGGVLGQGNRPWIPVTKGAVALLRTRVVGLAGFCVGQGLTHLQHEGIPVLPPLGQDQHLGGVAVEGPVVGHHAGDVLRLELQVGLGPGARHHKHGGHAAQLRGDGLGQNGLPRSLAAGPLLWGPAPNDSVVGGVRTGDVHAHNLRVVAEMSADLGAAVHDRQHPGLDERREGLLQDRTQVGVDRVGLEKDHLVFHEELVDHIQGSDGGDVASPEHQGHPSGGSAPLRLGPVQSRQGRRLARLDPDIPLETGEEHLVHPVGGKDVHHLLAVGEGGSAGHGRIPSIAHRLQGLGQKPQVPHAHHGAAQGDLPLNATA